MKYLPLLSGLRYHVITLIAEVSYELLLSVQDDGPELGVDHL